VTGFGFGNLLPPRSVEDILAERVRLVVDGQTYDLPVLPIAENRAWKERMDLELGYLLMKITTEDDNAAILNMFDGADAVWWELLTSYDATGVLPSRQEIERTETPMWLIRAVLEVWRAARPLADIALAGMESATPAPRTAGWRARITTWLRRLAGPSGTSSAS
jgi:hypothetical protein